MARKFFSHQALDGTRLQVGALNSASDVVVAFSTPGQDPQIMRLTPDKIDELITSLSHAREVLDRDVSYNDSLLWSN